MSELIDLLLSAEERSRNQHPPKDYIQLFAEVLCQNPDLKINQDSISELLETRRYRRAFSEYCPPSWVFNFVSRLACIEEVNSVIDPTCGMGRFLRTIVEMTKVPNAIGVESNESLHTIASRNLEDFAKVRLGSFLDGDNEIHNQFDLIISKSPIGRVEQTGIAPDQPNGVRVSDIEDELAYWGAQNVAARGQVIMIGSPKFGFDKKLRKRLTESEVGISAIIQIPPGTMSRAGTSTNILILKPEQQGQIFTAQVSEFVSHQEIILKNYRHHTEGNLPSQGAWIDLDDFRGYNALESSFRLRKKIRNTYFNPIKGSEIFSDPITYIQDTNSPETNDDPFSTLDVEAGEIILDTMGRVFPEEHSSRLMKGRLDLNLVAPEYFKRWIKSDIGQLSLDAYGTDAILKRLNPAIVNEAIFYLPSREIQDQIILNVKVLENIDSQIKETMSLCWDGQNLPDSLRHQVKKVNNEDTYKDWLETLPYPLASILWRHQTAEDSSIIRAPILSDFFEALAAFIATIHLSAFVDHGEIWEEELQRKLNRVLVRHGLSIEMATFGSWKCICEVISRASRDHLANEEQRNNLLGCYKLHDISFLNKLCSVDLTNILQHANQIRNRMAHGGAVSEATAQDIEQRLLGLVDETRALFGLSWKAYELLLSGSTRFLQDEFHTDTQRLVGTRSQFERATKITTSPMKDGQLYLLGEGESEALEVLPLLRMSSSPADAQNACYFYNSTVNGSLRFVSYHHEAQAEINESFPDTQSVLEMVTRVP